MPLLVIPYWETTRFSLAAICYKNRFQDISIIQSAALNDILKKTSLP